MVEVEADPTSTSQLQAIIDQFGEDKVRELLNDKVLE